MKLEDGVESRLRLKKRPSAAFRRKAFGAES